MAASRHLVDDLVLELRRDGSEVGVEETATSWVMLGREVYKIKKPVARPLLDLGSLAKREAACRVEISVNRRLAPRTQLGMTAVRRAPGGRASLRGRGPVIEWAVRMVRHEVASRADVLLHRGALGVDAIERLASSLAAFHADAPTDALITAHGAAEVVLARIAENAIALRETGDRFSSSEQVTEIERRQTSFVKSHELLFQDRMRGGFIRDGHGDLRIEHVYVMSDGDFELVGGIELDPDCRQADVCVDVASLTMDLTRLGRVDHAERFLAHYADAANDLGILALVDFYESDRASGRARPAALAALDPTMPDAIRRSAEADARRDLLFAFGLLGDAPRITAPACPGR